MWKKHNRAETVKVSPAVAGTILIKDKMLVTKNNLFFSFQNGNRTKLKI